MQMASYFDSGVCEAPYSTTSSRRRVSYALNGISCASLPRNGVLMSGGVLMSASCGSCGSGPSADCSAFGDGCGYDGGVAVTIPRRWPRLDGLQDSIVSTSR